MKQVLVLVSLTVLLTACGTRNEPPANQAAPQPNQDAPRAQRVPQTAPRPTYDQSPAATSARLAQIASRVRNVNDATAVVLGKFAVVGIDVNAHMDRSDVGITKFSVAEALKEDPQGATAIVTADPDVVQRLREMGEDIRRGRPVTGITQELADIVGRIIPQAPRNVERRERPDNAPNEQRKNKSPNVRPQGNEKIPVNK